MDFAYFKQKVEEEGQRLWEGWTKTVFSRGEMPSYLFFFFPKDSEKLQLTSIPLSIDKDELVLGLHTICAEYQVQHSCLISESYLANMKEADLEQTLAHIRSGASIKDLPGTIEVLFFNFSTVEEPHEHLANYQIIRPENTSPFLVNLPLSEADQTKSAGRFTGFYFQG